MADPYSPTPPEFPATNPFASSSRLALSTYDGRPTFPTHDGLGSALPHESYPSVYTTPQPTNSVPLLADVDAAASKETYEGLGSSFRHRPLYKRPLFWLAAVALLAVVVLAVILPVYFVVIKPNRHASQAAVLDPTSPSNPHSATNPESPVGATSGGNGSIVIAQDGTQFVYNNSFGGYWVYDAKNPFNDSARPNAWTPPLNTSWTFGRDHIYGVNIGGLFVLEPFITPALYEQFAGAVDEWTLSTLLTANGSDTLAQTLENHYDTFITEMDIAQIAGAGLNWIRVPIPFWAIETWADVGVDASGNTVSEPFLARVCWKYVLRLIGWARKYGLRVELDLHTVPGSQNGYNHSGKLGPVNFLNGVMGIANAQRTLDYIRIITEFISQPEYQNVIPMFGIVNEALLTTIGMDQLTSFYMHAHNLVRSITGYGEGNGPYIAIHDGFVGTARWKNFLPGSDRIALDTHPYFAFDGQPNNEPLAVPATGSNGTDFGGKWPQQACSAWGPGMNNSQRDFGVTIAGEFSNGFNDCGLFVEGVGNKASYGGDCSLWQDSSQWNQTMKAGLLNYALASMDALGDWFFWTWKIGPSSTTNTVQAPLWSYQLGLQQGWMPTDPRVALGKCASLGVTGVPFDGQYQAWQTGGAGAGTIAPSAVTEFGAWPPTSIAGVPAGQATLLPQYTATASVVTLPPPTLTAATVSVGDGWADAADGESRVTAVAGCVYPDAWDATGSPISVGMCGATDAAEPTTAPTPTPTSATTTVATPTPTPTPTPALTPAPVVSSAEVTVASVSSSATVGTSDASLDGSLTVAPTIATTASTSSPAASPARA